MLLSSILIAITFLFYAISLLHIKKGDFTEYFYALHVIVIFSFSHSKMNYYTYNF